MTENHKDTTVKRLARGLGLVGYYGFARYLPVRPAWFGDRLRHFCCRGVLTRCGKTARIGKWAYFGTGKGLVIGEHSDIGIRCHIYGIGGWGELQIGDGVLMGPDVVIITVKHRMEPSSPIPCQHNSGTKVVIEDDVWIGIRATILPGITVSRGAVVGACALVTKDVPPYSVVGGVPARIIRTRQHTYDFDNEKWKRL